MSIPDPRLPLHKQLPPQSEGISQWVTSEENPPFWKPSPGEILKHMGWRIVFFLPALGLVGGVVAMVMMGISMAGCFNAGGIKLAIIICAAPFLAAGYGIKLALHARKDAFCIHCGYSLEGLPQRHRCPECGRPYDKAICDEYRRDPAWFVKRFKERRYALPTVALDVPENSVKRKSRDGT